MNHKPKFSIITVCLNSVATIERTINSVLNQTYPNIEYLIIDGGSTDGTCEIINKYKDRLAYYCSEPDGGLYHAMNKGICHATGDVVALLNSDDWYLEGALTIVAEQFEETKADVLCFGITREDEYGERKDRYPRVRIDENGFERLEELFHPATFAKKSIFDAIGDFDTQYHIAADYDWLVRMKKNGYTVECIAQVTTYYSDGGLSSKCWYEGQGESRQIDLKYAHSKEEREDIYAVYDEKMIYRRYVEILEQGNPCYLSAEDMNYHNHENVFIFGAGSMGQECYQLLQQSKIGIKGFLDNNPDIWGKQLKGYPIMPPTEIDIERDVVVVAIMQYEEVVEEQLFQMGMQADRVVALSVLKNKVYAQIKEELGASLSSNSSDY